MSTMSSLFRKFTLCLCPGTAVDLYPTAFSSSGFLHRKEVIQPQVPLGLPCYDLVPITNITLGRRPLSVG